MNKTSEEPICLLKERRVPRSPTWGHPGRRVGKHASQLPSFYYLWIKERFDPPVLLSSLHPLPLFLNPPPSFLPVVVTELTCLWSGVGLTSCSPRVLFLLSQTTFMCWLSLPGMHDEDWRRAHVTMFISRLRESRCWVCKIFLKGREVLVCMYSTEHLAMSDAFSFRPSFPPSPSCE